MENDGSYFLPTFPQHLAPLKRATNGKSSKLITVNVGNVRVEIHSRSRVVLGIAYKLFAVADYSSGRRKFINLAS